VTDEAEFEHELKNHLAIILGYADLLREEMPADDPRMEDLSEIHKAATAAIALLNSHRGPNRERA
jgi:signal transduction histidine kinase